jgi:hypothetical protein
MVHIESLPAYFLRKTAFAVPKRISLALGFVIFITHPGLAA